MSTMRDAPDLARALLRERERNARLVMESIPGLVALLTVDGQVYFANRRLLDLTGHSLEELGHNKSFFLKLLPQ